MSDITDAQQGTVDLQTAVFETAVSFESHDLSLIFIAQTQMPCSGVREFLEIRSLTLWIDGGDGVTEPEPKQFTVEARRTYKPVNIPTEKFVIGKAFSHSIATDANLIHEFKDGHELIVKTFPNSRAIFVAIVVEGKLANWAVGAFRLSVSDSQFDYDCGGDFTSGGFMRGPELVLSQ